MDTPMVTNIVVALIAALVGSGTGGFLVAWRRDSRQVPIDEAAARRAKVEVTEMIEELATRAVEKAKEQMAQMEQEAQKALEKKEQQHGKEIALLHTRITQLENTMRANGLSVPPWLTGGQIEGGKIV